MRPSTVRFSSLPHAYRVVADQCDNPECACADVMFYFTPVPADRSADLPVEAPAAEAPNDAAPFQIRVDPEAWQEMDPPERPAAVAAAAAEFLRDYPQAERSALADRARRKKETARRLREYRLDPRDIERGLFVSFGQIAHEGGSIATGGSGFSYRLKHDGHEYLIDDVYCPNPDCPCNEAHLWFFEFKPAAAPGGEDLAEQSFMARVPLDGKRVTVEKLAHGPAGEAERAAEAWREKFGTADGLEQLKWRYEKVKEIARRSLRSAGGPRRPGTRARAARPVGLPPIADHLGVAPRFKSMAPPASRPGRNDPCPCGSGKKYKKCCGR